MKADRSRARAGQQPHLRPQYIYAEEHENLFTRAGLFVWHESLLPNPFDYFVRAGQRVGVFSAPDEAIPSCHTSVTRHEALSCNDAGTPQSFVSLHPGRYGIDGPLSAFHMTSPLTQFDLLNVRCLGA